MIVFCAYFVSDQFAEMAHLLMLVLQCQEMSRLSFELTRKSEIKLGMKAGWHGDMIMGFTMRMMTCM